jgi:hypothetical protein
MSLLRLNRQRSLSKEREREQIPLGRRGRPPLFRQKRLRFRIPRSSRDDHISRTVAGTTLCPFIFSLGIGKESVSSKPTKTFPYVPAAPPEKWSAPA